jgi:hypothetical protein
MEQDFGPNGIGRKWCDDPNMLAISGGAELSSADVAPTMSQCARPGRTSRTPPIRPTVRVEGAAERAPNVDPGTVTVYAVCAEVK